MANEDIEMLDLYQTRGRDRIAVAEGWGVHTRLLQAIERIEEQSPSQGPAYCETCDITAYDLRAAADLLERWLLAHER